MKKIILFAILAVAGIIYFNVLKVQKKKRTTKVAKIGRMEWL